MRIQRWRTAAVATGVAGALVGTLGTQASATGTERAPAAPVVDLRADVNRDGRVDIGGDSDTAGEDTWTKRRGAVVLPNIDDDRKDCPVRDGSGRPLTDAELARCNDAADTVVNGAHDALDLARLRLVPQRELADGTTARVEILDKDGSRADRARVFTQLRGWRQLTPSDRIGTDALRYGLELGVEATDVVRDAAVWDGTVVVRVTLTDAQGRTSSDEVTLRTAPVLTHHHVQRTQQVVVSKVAGDMPGAPWFTPAQHKFVKELGPVARQAGVPKPLKVLDDIDDPWAQDFVEPGYVSMAGSDGKQHALRVMIRSAQPDRDAGRELFTQLRGRDVGVVQFDGPTAENPGWTLNSMGNLETIPPYRNGSKDYPAGRIIMGQWGDYGIKPAKSMTTFLSSQGADRGTKQGMQKPLLLDTNWLAVGHVDEFVQFLPAKTERGWRIAVSDPEAGLDILRKAKAEGHGGKRVFSVPGVKGRPAPRVTIDQALADRKFLADNQLAQERIAANLRVLKKETGVTDKEIIKVPSLFAEPEIPEGAAKRTNGTKADKADEFDKADKGGKEAKGPRGIKLGRLGADVLTGGTDRERIAGDSVAPVVTHTLAYIPGAVNGVVLSDKDYLSAKQWGPVIGGVDVFGEAVSAAYARAGMRTVYLDDYNSYHFGGGEVHCGTNTLRDTSARWWRS
ncbi:protein-arginine deiminase domain-containing protein [Streptomyces sp. NPDC000594]|uniref:protein-arginine deiminase domain-containing protein n=1 Tax=Streptomyces sp. NPDC000594 TaxID=3154261 RepID=UPI00331AE657